MISIISSVFDTVWFRIKYMSDNRNYMGLGTKTDLSLDLNSNRHNDIGQDAQQNCWLNEETDK